MNQELFSMVIKLVIASALGGLIGLERETHGRPAGLRTHILVSLGSALFTVVSNSYGGPMSDPGRIASQIVSGIGFLGAGTIIRQGSIIRGLTTAASLWTTAAIGMAVGAGGVLVYLAVVASVVVFATLSLISQMEVAIIARRDVRDLVVLLPGVRASVHSLVAAVVETGASVLSMRREVTPSGALEVRVKVRVPEGATTVGRISAGLSTMEDIQSFEWE